MQFPNSALRLVSFTLMTLTLFFIGLGCATAKDYDLDYYKDGKFRNLADIPSKTPLGYVWMKMNTTSEEWPEKVELQENIILPSAKSEKLKIHYINHSTFLIQSDGINILTDPIFSERASPLTWAGPKRVIKPAFEMAALPKIDYIIISHDHYDHLDLPSIEFFVKRDNPKILMGLGVGGHLTAGQSLEMQWWQEQAYKKVSFVFAPAQHSSGRGLLDQKSTLWGAFVIKAQNKLIYFAGDTGYADHFQKVFEKFGAIDVALIPIGAYKPRSFMKCNHMDPKEAVKAHYDLKSKNSIGMHWGTFQLTNEGRLRPKEYFQKKPVENFVVPENGDCFILTENKLKKCETNDQSAANHKGYSDSQIYRHLHQATRWAELLTQKTCLISRSAMKRHLKEVKYNNPLLIKSPLYKN